VNIEINIFNDSALLATLKGSLFLRARNFTKYGYFLEIGPVAAGDPYSYKNITATATATAYTKIWELFPVQIYTEKTNKIGIITLC
jgi:hypothetical protein